MNRLTLSLVALAAVAQAGAQSPSPLGDKLAAYFRPYVDGMNFNGAVLVAKSGRVLLREAHGVSDVRTGTPLTLDSRFRVGQLSEAFTATGIFLLKQRGKLSLDDPLSKFVQGFGDGDAITIRNLLVHDSGITGLTDAPAFRADSARPHSLAEIVEWLRRGPYPSHRTPGSFTYASADYVLLAAVIERVTGQRYGEWLRENVFVPARMHDTGEDGDSVARPPTPAARHYASGPYDAEPAGPFDFSNVTGSASLYSTVDDLYRFDRVLRAGTLLNAATVDEMFATRRSGMATGVWRVNTPGERSFAVINTRSPGVEASFERYPDDDLCVVLLSNVFSSLTHSTADELAAVALGESRVSPAPSQRVSVRRETLTRYVGRYQLGADFISGATLVEVTLTPTGLALRSSTFAWPSHLVPRGDNAFLDRMYGGIVSFTSGPKGEVDGFRWQRGRTYSARRVGGE